MCQRYYETSFVGGDALRTQTMLDLLALGVKLATQLPVLLVIATPVIGLINEPHRLDFL